MKSNEILTNMCKTKYREINKAVSFKLSCVPFCAQTYIVSCLNFVLVGAQEEKRNQNSNSCPFNKWKPLHVASKSFPSLAEQRTSNSRMQDARKPGFPLFSQHHCLQRCVRASSSSSTRIGRILKELWLGKTGSLRVCH